MAKTPFDAERGGSLLKFDPDEIIIIEDPDHPRYDKRIQRPITEEFLQSLARGQIEPGVVCRDDNGKPEIINGRRRLRGYRILNSRLKAGESRYQFTAVFRNVKNDEEAIAARHEANLHEGDTVMDKAHAAEDFARRFGWSPERTGVLFGEKKAVIEKWLIAVQLAKPVQDAIDAGRVGLAAAIALVELPKAEQIERVRQIQEGVKAPREAKGDGKKPTPASKSGRPPAAIVKKLVTHEFRSDPLNPQARLLLSFFAGKASQAELLKAIPKLAEALG